jgi:hypothetical protein
MGVLFNILFVIAVMATIISLCVFLGSLIILFEKDELPDIEDF